MQVRQVVTGHDAKCRAVFARDEQVDRGPDNPRHRVAVDELLPHGERGDDPPRFPCHRPVALGIVEVRDRTPEPEVGRERHRAHAYVQCFGAGLAKVTSMCRAVHCSKPQSRAGDALRDSPWRGHPARLPGCPGVAGPTGWKLRGPDDHAAGNPGITPHDRDAGAPARRGLRRSPLRRASPPPGKPALPPYGQPSRV